MLMKRILKVIVFCSIVILLHGCFSSDASSERACQGFGFDAYRTLEKTFSGLPLTITAHRRIADDFQCVSASYKGNTTVIDKSIRTPFGLNMILGNNIAGRPFLIVASSMGDEPDSGYEVTLYDVKTSTKLVFGKSISMPLFGDINNDSIDELVFFNNNTALDSVASIELGWPTVLKLTDPITIESISNYPVLIEKLTKSSELWIDKLSGICGDEGDLGSSCTGVADVEKIRSQLLYMESIKNNVE